MYIEIQFKNMNSFYLTIDIYFINNKSMNLTDNLLSLISLIQIFKLLKYN